MTYHTAPRRVSARRATRTTMGMAVAALVLGSPGVMLACDLCAIYAATETREGRTGARVGVAEQFARYTTVQRDGEEVANPAGERLDSAITQFVFGYNVTPRVGVQLNVPLITRVFRRQEAMGVVSGDETGIGDLSLLGTLVAFSDITERSVVRFSLLGGLKLPSGNSRRLREELSASMENEMGAMRAHDHEGHGDPPLASGVHGHDLALGSGSVDGILGAQLFWSWRRLFLAGALQYLLRTEGDFSYDYANDLMWSGGPGAFALLGPDSSLGVQAVLSGESKGKDAQAGMTMDDSAITTLYVGPGLLFTWGGSLGADVVADLPLIEHNSALQLVPDYRLRGGLTWRF